MLRAIVSRAACHKATPQPTSSFIRNSKRLITGKNGTLTLTNGTYNHLPTKRLFCTVSTEENPDYAGPEGNRLRAEAQKFAEERHALMSEASKLFEAGDKAKAKELSEQGKAAGKKMEEANAKAAEVILQHRNGDHPVNYLDLHGLYLEEALAAFRLKLSQLQAADSADEIIFEVIPGAGNHSKNKAIIKPKVIEELRAMNLYFEEKNAGTLLVYVNGGGLSTTSTPASTSASEKQDNRSNSSEGESQSGEKNNASGSEGNRGFGAFAALILLASVGSVAAYATFEPHAEEDAHKLIERVKNSAKDKSK